MPSKSEMFRARAEARALLWAAGEFDLHAAVDELQAWADQLGLGADVAQTIMGEAFGAVRDDLPVSEWREIAQGAWENLGWIEAAEEYHRNRPPTDPRIKGTFAEMCAIADAIEAAKPKPPDPPKEAPQATVEALMLGLRERGVVALEEGPVQRRLAQLSANQLAEVGSRLLWRTAVTVHSQPAQFERSWRRWKTKEVHQLLQKWAALHGNG